MFVSTLASALASVSVSAPTSHSVRLCLYHARARGWYASQPTRRVGGLPDPWLGGHLPVRRDHLDEEFTRLAETRLAQNTLKYLKHN